MPKSGRKKLEIRLSNLVRNAHFAKEGKVDLLYNAPIITSQQLMILNQRSDVRGVYKKPVIRDFRSALRRHRNRQLRMYARNCQRHVRALRKVIASYVCRPGYTEAEMEKLEKWRPTESLVFIDHGYQYSQSVTGYMNRK